MRTSTNWNHFSDERGAVQLISGDEGTGVRVASVEIAGDDTPAQRLYQDNGEWQRRDLEDEDDTVPGRPSGLYVIGTSKWHRPSLAEACELIPKAEPLIYAALAELPLNVRFRSLVAASGLSYRKLAVELDVSKSYIADRMSGRRDVRRLDVLALERLLQCEPLVNKE